MNTIVQSRVLSSLLCSSLCLGTLLAQQSKPEGNPPAAHPEEAERQAKLRQAIEKGATMEEIAALKEASMKTPAEAIHALKAGNSRFFGVHAHRPEISANERRAQILGQTPFAVDLGCSDSRVPTELVYDQGLGDIFTVRVAGQILEPGTAGSIEYAVAHLRTKVVVVMGHEGCGAVKAAMLDRGTDQEGTGECAVSCQRDRTCGAKHPTHS